MNTYWKPSILLSTISIAIISFAGADKSHPSKSIVSADFFIDSLIDKMTLDEKIGQLTLFTSGWEVTGPSLNEDYKNELKAGRVGALFNAHTVTYNKSLQKTAVEETRLGIPLLFGYDVIHGHKTIFPIPLAEACSWNMELIEQSAMFSAKEAAASGLNWAFNPMVDVSRDPRWGRVAEGSGEDTYLGSLVAKAKVRGYQGSDLSSKSTLLACVKHFAAYGAPLAGRDYGTVDMSDRVLRETYLPPYKAAVEAGVATVMTSFNELNGMPASGSKYLMTDILRDEWGFEGFVVTDYTAINEIVDHGVAANEKQACELAFKAGVDMDMQGSVYMNHLRSLIKEGKVSEDRLNQSVRKVLKMKYQLGLFDDPYRYLSEEREKQVVLSDELKTHALKASTESIVLLKNEPVNGNKLLPIEKTVKKIALIGPLSDNKIDLLGSWHASGEGEHITTLLQALKNKAPESEINYVKGTGFNHDDGGSFKEAIIAAGRSDLVIMALGENHKQNGEAASRSKIDLPGRQKELLKAIHKTGKPVILVVMAGRPLTLVWENENIPAILYAWHLGTMAAEAITDILYGHTNPSGKLTMTFPKNVGQIPIFYNDKNTGRPFDKNEKYTSKYLDVANTPLYPFGYGLSYTSFEYADIRLNKNTYGFGEEIQISVEVKNTGDRDGQEVVQLYTRDLVGSVTRPIKELKRFKKISLEPGESRLIKFSLTSDDLAFYTKDMEFKTEPGEFEIFVGTNSQKVLRTKFNIQIQ